MTQDIQPDALIPSHTIFGIFTLFMMPFPKKSAEFLQQYPICVINYDEIETR
jgi:hypothetical protein